MNCRIKTNTEHQTDIAFWEERSEVLGAQCSKQVGVVFGKKLEVLQLLDLS